MWEKRAELYAAWAPDGARWSPWVKPVLFATLDEPIAVLAPAARDVDWAPPAWRLDGEPAGDATYRQADEPGPRVPGDTALVLELAGVLSLETALALAAVGYRPVPILSATPSPYSAPPLVDVRSLQSLLVAGASLLRDLALPPDAPPAFVLDAGRLPQVSARPGQYDNRSLVFPQDFPSAAHLREGGIGRVLVVSTSTPVARDLSHVLVPWRDAGLSLESQRPERGAAREAPVLQATEPGSMIYRAFALLGLARSAAGGFGAVVPQPSSGGG